MDQNQTTDAPATADYPHWPGQGRLIIQQARNGGFFVDERNEDRYYNSVMACFTKPTHLLMFLIDQFGRETTDEVFTALSLRADMDSIDDAPPEEEPTPVEEDMNLRRAIEVVEAAGFGLVLKGDFGLPTIAMGELTMPPNTSQASGLAAAMTLAKAPEDTNGA